MDRARAFKAIYGKWKNKVAQIKENQELGSGNNYNHIVNNLLQIMSFGCYSDELGIKKGSKERHNATKNFLYGTRLLRKYMRLIDSSSTFRAGELSSQYFPDIRASTIPKDEWNSTNPDEHRDGLENYISQAEERLWFVVNFR